MLCGLLRPTSGSSEVLGLAIPAQAEALRRRIGYMTQRFSLFEDLSVRENLEFMGQIHSLPRVRRRTRVRRLLLDHGLEGLAGQRAGTLSGGERQRLALAAALLHEPELLFLDEPTSAVDPESRRQLWDRLFLLVDAGTTILVSTHYMDEAERCHSLAILKQGRLVARGAPRALIDELPALVVEVETVDAAGARRELAKEDLIVGVAQLGARLRVLVRRRRPGVNESAREDGGHGVRDVDEALEVVRRALGERNESRLVIARPNLEDVFVVSTQDRRAVRSPEPRT
jgi:ABC-2 type transport system ATP-binding protein